MPPPDVDDVCLEECLKAVYKQRDAFHIFLLPQWTWVGVVVFNNEKLGFVVLTFQEKWDKLKSICNKWLI